MDAMGVMHYRARMRSTVLLVMIVVLCACGSVASNPDASASTIDAPQLDALQGRRCDPTQPFLNPTLVPNINSASNDVLPRLSLDELELFFASQRSGGAGAYDLYVAKRTSRDAEFGAPEPILELNTSDSEDGAYLASDNLTLYYADRHALD